MSWKTQVLLEQALRDGKTYAVLQTTFLSCENRKEENNQTSIQSPNTFRPINMKKTAFGNKEHTTDSKMGVSVLLRLFISSHEVCTNIYAR